VTPFDPVTYASTALLLMVTTAVATLIPARRAASVDPLIALRTS
jgi:ABC-type lipoprotein release transport system permease subunit